MADVRELGSNRGFIKWPVDAACVGTTKAAEFIVQAFFFFFFYLFSIFQRCRASEPRNESPVSSLSENQDSSEQLASNIHPSIVYLFPLAGSQGRSLSQLPSDKSWGTPWALSSAWNRSTGLPCRHENISPLIQEASSSEEVATRNHKDIYI